MENPALVPVYACPGTNGVRQPGYPPGRRRDAIEILCVGDYGHIITGGLRREAKPNA